MAHHRFRDTPQHPAFDAGSPVRRHRDQIVRRFLSQQDNFIGGKTFLGDARDLRDPKVFEIGCLLVEILRRFIAHTGEHLVVVAGVKTLLPAVNVVRNVIGADQFDLQIELLAPCWRPAAARPRQARTRPAAQ